VAAHLVQAGADVGGTGQPGLVEPVRLPGHQLGPVRWQVEQPAGGRVGHRGQHDQVAEPVQQVGREPARLVAALDDPVHHAEGRRAVGGRERVRNLVQQAGVGEAEQRHRALVAEPGLVAARQQLVQDGQRVPGRGAGPDHQGTSPSATPPCRRMSASARAQHGTAEGERIVGCATDGRDDLSASVAKMNFRCGGGSSTAQQRVEALGTGASSMM
jgi:hypothetical protein